jgi:nitroimidazol reductase NimA-like FMN-containing flavoprotein (pyridoxamine 5'-phosphate oxidase superfamily)
MLTLFERVQEQGVLDIEGLELLDEVACLALIATAEVGRVGVCIGALPAIFPVNFALDGRDVFFQTSAGTKLSAATDHAVVAFQCDHFDGADRSGWSVQAVGVAEVVTGPDELARFKRLHVQPWVEGIREHVVKISLEMLTGRRIIHEVYSEV